MDGGIIEGFHHHTKSIGFSPQWKLTYIDEYEGIFMERWVVLGWYFIKTWKISELLFKLLLHDYSYFIPNFSC
jgi:hypothetical protein